MKIRFQMVQFSKSHAIDLTMATFPTFKTWKVLSKFQMCFDQMAAICPYFKWLGFQISFPMQNPDHLQNLFLTIQNPDLSVFQIPTVIV